MNNMVLFLSSEPQIREVALLLGIESSPALICDICRTQKLDYLTVYAPTPKFMKETEQLLEDFRYEQNFHLPEHLEILLDENPMNYQKKTDQMVLVFDALPDNEAVLSLSDLRPQYLVGTLCTTKMNSFKIWEVFRLVSEHIYILSWAHGRTEEAMNWTRSDTNIELSVVLPMYNVERYLSQCIESVTAWKAEYIEFLFVDDGSPDNCVEIVKQYAKKDSRIQLLCKENGGCASARQYGLQSARGRYVGFIDPDDFINESMYRKLMSRALIGSYEICYCGYKEFYEETKTMVEIPDVLGWPYTYGTADPQKINELLAYRRVAIWRAIYLKEMITRNGIHFYTDLRRFDDLPFKMETLARARSVVAVPEYLYYYRMFRPGQDVSADDERLYVHFDIFHYLDKFFEGAKDKKQLDYLQICKLQTHRWAIDKIKPQFLREYCKRAKIDLKAKFGFGKGFYIIKHCCSRSDLAYYVFIYLGWISLIRFLKVLKGKEVQVYAKQINKLKEIATDYKK